MTVYHGFEVEIRTTQLRVLSAEASNESFASVLALRVAGPVGIWTRHVPASSATRLSGSESMPNRAARYPWPSPVSLLLTETRRNPAVS
jgi:hypothetical protein